MTLLTFIVLIVVGATFSGKGGDADGHEDRHDQRLRRLDRRDRDATVAPCRCRKPGINQLANETGHLRVAVNFDWLLLTGFLVLFMQVGFAFLVTGLTRAKNAGHMMMMNIAVVRGRAHRVLRGRLRVPVRRRRAGRQPRRPRHR